MPIGRLFTMTMGELFDAAKLRNVGQPYEERPTIVINLKTLELTGFQLYADVLAAADDIYTVTWKPQTPPFENSGLMFLRLRECVRTVGDCGRLRVCDEMVPRRGLEPPLGFPN